MATILKGKTFINRFDPSLVSGLQLWLDASDPSTLFQDSAATTPATADSDPIGCWKDKSGNNYHALQTDGTFKPLRKNAIQNSKNVIRFDGTNDRLNCGNVLNIRNYYISIFATVKISGSSGGICAKSLYGNPSMRYSLYKYGGSVGFMVHPPYIESPKDLSVSDNNSNFMLLSGIYKRDAYTVYLRQNKNQIGSLYGNEYTYPSAASDYNTNYAFIIGNYQDPSGQESNYNPLNGDIGEIIVYIGNEVSSTQRDIVETYLFNKWGIS